MSTDIAIVHTAIASKLKEALANEMQQESSQTIVIDEKSDARIRDQVADAAHQGVEISINRPDGAGDLRNAMRPLDHH